MQRNDSGHDGLSLLAGSTEDRPAEEAARIAERAGRHGTGAVLDALQKAEERSKEESGRAIDLIIHRRTTRLLKYCPNKDGTYSKLAENLEDQWCQPELTA